MRLKVLIGLFVMLALISRPAIAQPKSQITHYSTEEGLSHENLTSMLQDREGFMWFGTWDGINRYDGHRFINYKARSGDNSVLRNNRIDKMAEDAYGFLWLRVYDNQIYRFDKKHETFYSVSQHLKDAFKYNFLRMQTSRTGAVWLFTEQHGLFCTTNPQADRPGFTQYSAALPGNAHLPSNQISFLHLDFHDNVWVGTDSGLAHLVKKRGEYVAGPSQLKAFSGMSFAAVTENETNIWFGTKNGYLVSCNKLSGNISSKKVSAAAINGLSTSKKRGVVYATTNAGELITLQLSTLNYTTAKLAGQKSAFSIFEDKDEMLWIEPDKYGIIRYNPNTATYKTYARPNQANYTAGRGNYRVMQDDKGRIWANLKGGGFTYYDARRDEVVYYYYGADLANHRATNMVQSYQYDPAGVMWITSDERGLNKVVFQPNDFKHRLLVDSSYSKPDNEVRGLCADRKGRVWLATKGGKLYLKDADGQAVKYTFINADNNLLGQIYSIYQDHNGTVWFGTKTEGLFSATPVDKEETRYRVEQYKHDKNNPNSISSDEVYAITEDKTRRLWVGTFDNGLNLVEGKGKQVRFLNNQYFKNYPAKFNKIRHISHDVYGRLWLGTTNGLVVMTTFDRSTNTGIFTTFAKKPGDANSLANNDVQYILKDRRNRMWIATAGGGVNVVRPGKNLSGLQFDTYTTATGLPNDYVLSLAEDKKGNIWAATQKGLTRFNVSGKQTSSFDSEDGLPNTRFAEAACTQLSNGNLVLGTIHGYINFNPANVANNRIKGNMILAGLQVNNKHFAALSNDSLCNPNYVDRVVLQHDQNVLSIDFTVLDYRTATKQNYQYRLKGFEDDWQDSKAQHTASYTNLPPGNYQFEVRCVNADLYSNVPYKKLDITIQPPFWRSWWAYSIYIVIALVLLEIARRTVATMLGLRQRIAVEQQLAEVKMDFFTNVSHELRTPLTLILNPIEEISAQEALTDQGRQYANVIRRNANRMVRFINQLLDLRKVQSGKAQLNISRAEMVSFINRIISYFTEGAREKNIHLDFQHQDEELFAWIDAEKIDIVVFNIMANAVKFSPEGKTITIKLWADNNVQRFGIEISDEGAGVPEERLNDIFELYYEGEHAEGGGMKGTGIGLALSKEFVALHHGKISAQNLNGKGFSVKVDLQLGRAHFNHEEARVVDAPLIDRAEDLEAYKALTATVAATGDGATQPRVLLVEDNQELRLFLQQQLSALYQVQVAEDGADGLEKAIAWLPDLIVSDVMMPKLDGIQMLDKLKNDVSTSHIPVVLLTARFAIEHQIEGLKYGADLYITKPFQNAYLLAGINNLLQQRRRLFENLADKQKTITLAPGEVVITSKDETFLKQIIEIVEQRMEDPDFSVEQVAETIGMGRTTFYTKFKSLTNLAPVEFVRDMRLMRGKQLLDAGETNIATVAYSVGFNNAKYFSTCFKEKYHLTPSGYLKEARIK